MNRNLAEICQHCDDRDSNILTCCEICAVPMNILEAIEKARQENKKFIPNKNYQYDKKGILEFIKEMTVIELLRIPGGEYADGYKDAIEDSIDYIERFLKEA